jgi:hypothetical protein
VKARTLSARKHKCQNSKLHPVDLCASAYKIEF